MPSYHDCANNYSSCPYNDYAPGSLRADVGEMKVMMGSLKVLVEGQSKSLADLKKELITGNGTPGRIPAIEEKLTDLELWRVEIKTGVHDWSAISKGAWLGVVSIISSITALAVKHFWFR